MKYVDGLTYKVPCSNRVYIYKELEVQLDPSNTVLLKLMVPVDSPGSAEPLSNFENDLERCTLQATTLSDLGVFLVTVEATMLVAAHKKSTTREVERLGDTLLDGKIQELTFQCTNVVPIPSMEELPEEWGAIDSPLLLDGTNVLIQDLLPEYKA